MVTLFIPSGIVQIDPATVTDAELAALGLTRAWADDQVAEELANHRGIELYNFLKVGAHVVVSNPPAGGKQVTNVFCRANGKAELEYETGG